MLSVLNLNGFLSIGSTVTDETLFYAFITALIECTNHQLTGTFLHSNVIYDAFHYESPSENIKN